MRVLKAAREKIYGFDLNPFACYLAEVNLLIQVLDAIRALPQDQRLVGLERFHIYNVDSLARAGRGVLALGHDSLLAEELDTVEHIKNREAPYQSGFSHVVANPPYGAKLSDDYKSGLKRDYPGVFRGQPDTYVFFYALGLELLSSGGRLGFITPNTFLMGTNTDVLRGALLNAGQIERIVDLPQGLWKDATVNCVLLFLRKAKPVASGAKGLGLTPPLPSASPPPRGEEMPSDVSVSVKVSDPIKLTEASSPLGGGDAEGRGGVSPKPQSPNTIPSDQTVEVNLMDLRDGLDKLTARAWAETLTQDQSQWQADPANAIDIRRDAIQHAIEAACTVQKKMVVNGKEMEFPAEVLRLGDIIESSPRY